MTAPDTSSPRVIRESGSAALSIGLERPRHPGHLGLIAVQVAGLGAAEGLSLSLHEPEDRKDRFAALRARERDLVLAAPLDLLEPAAAGCEAIGCIFAASGGVLVREDRLGRLRGGETLRVATPSAGPIGVGLCRRVLQGWAGNQGFAVAETQVVVDAVAERPLEALTAGYDAAWLAYGCTDAIEASRAGLAVRLVTTEEAGLPAVAALELVACKDRSPQEIARHDALIVALEAATAGLVAAPERAVALWQRSGGGDDADRVQTTLPFLKKTVDRSPARWRALHELFAEA